MTANVHNDGLFQTKSVYQPHENLLYVEKSQINEKTILAANAEKQKMEQRKMDWGRQVASIPHILYDKWCRENPELRSKDKEVRGKKLLELIRANPQVMVVEAKKV